MIRLHRTHLQPIGLDIGGGHARLLQLEEAGGELSVVAAAEHVLSDGGGFDPLLRVTNLEAHLTRLLRQGGFRGRNVVVAVPREMVLVKNLRLPPMPQAELESAVQLEAPNLFGFGADEGRIQYLPAGEVRQGAETRQEVIVAAVRNDDLDRYVERLHQCGIIVQSIDFEPCALFRGTERFIRRKEDESEVQVLADIGLTRSCILIARGRDITFYKSLDIGGRRFDDAVAGKLGMALTEASELRRRLSETSNTPLRADPVRQAVYDAVRTPVEELGREISLCLRYYSVTFRGQRPSRMRLLGGEACDMQLQKMLSGAVAIPVETGRPLYSIDTSRMDPAHRRGSMSQWAVALGLSLRMTKGTFKPRDGKPRDPNAERQDLPAVDAADAPAPPAGVGEVEPVAASEPAAVAVGEAEVAHA